MLRRVEIVMWIGFLLCATLLVAVQIQVHASERNAAQIRVKTGVAAVSIAASKAVGSSDPNDVTGRLEIPAIGLTVPIAEGTDSSTLRVGVGHIPGTALPGGLGNMGLAGHRDTFFRPLRNIRKGMTMSVVTAEGRYNYVVDATQIVAPENVSVLAIHNAPEMTLITCYPFSFIGSAPKRFVVTAELQSLEPDEAGN